MANDEPREYATSYHMWKINGVVFVRRDFFLRFLLLRLVAVYCVNFILQYRTRDEEL